MSRLVVLVAVLVCAQTFAWGRRIVTVGDVHGDLGALTRILQKTGVIDAGGKWAGGETILVQTGDFMDRGPDVRALMDFLMRLEEEAPRGGGRVEVLLGNHEIMNLVSDFRDVNPAAYLAFRTGRSEKNRQKSFQRYLDIQRRRFQSLGQEDELDPEELRRTWMQEHPPGFEEYQEALSPSGKYGKWLRRRDVVAKIDDIIFIHAGIHPDLAGESLEKINARVKEELEVFETYREYLQRKKITLPFFTLSEMTVFADLELKENDVTLETLPTFRMTMDRRLYDHLRMVSGFLSSYRWYIFHSDGPLWFRGFDEWSDEEGFPQVENLLEAFDARHFVCGHSIQFKTGIRQRFSGRIFLIDTAMSRFYQGGLPSALEIVDGRFTAVYEDWSKPLFDRSGVLAGEMEQMDGTPGLLLESELSRACEDPAFDIERTGQGPGDRCYSVSQ